MEGVLQGSLFIIRVSLLHDYSIVDEKVENLPETNEN
jgi:hypothetical protein